MSKLNTSGGQNEGFNVGFGLIIGCRCGSFFVFWRLFFILNVVMIMEAKAQNAVFNRVKVVPGRKKWFRKEFVKAAHCCCPSSFWPSYRHGRCLSDLFLVPIFRSRKISEKATVPVPVPKAVLR